MTHPKRKARKAHKAETAKKRARLKVAGNIRRKKGRAKGKDWANGA